jgi:RNA polymerase sigma-70 factor (ECF subfamily)
MDGLSCNDDSWRGDRADRMTTSTDIASMEPASPSGHDLVVAVNSESELWQRIAADDVGAFGELYERHAKPVYNFCFRQLANWAQAEDLVSEVFLVAWRRRGCVELSTDSGSSLPWLLGVAVNVLRNTSRSARRASSAFDRLNEPRAQADFSDDLIDRLADEEQMREVLSLVSRLQPHEQDALAVCAWAGLSYEDAAIALGVPVGTVRSRLARARAHLRELMPASGHELGDERVVRSSDGHA